MIEKKCVGGCCSMFSTEYNAENKENLGLLVTLKLVLCYLTKQIMRSCWFNQEEICGESQKVHLKVVKHL